MNGFPLELVIVFAVLGTLGGILSQTIKEDQAAKDTAVLMYAVGYGVSFFVTIVGLFDMLILHLHYL